MPKYSPVTGKALSVALKKTGSQVQRVKGSHHFPRHPDGRTTVVPVHAGEALWPGLLAKVLRDAELTRHELDDLMA